jgi:hypothetical protein
MTCSRLSPSSDNAGGKAPEAAAVTFPPDGEDGEVRGRLRQGMVAWTGLHEGAWDGETKRVQRLVTLALSLILALSQTLV